MSDYMLIVTDTLEARAVSLEDAAELMGIGIEEAKWAIDEFGRCDTDGYIVLLRNPLHTGEPDKPIVAA